MIHHLWINTSGRFAFQVLDLKINSVGTDGRKDPKQNVIKPTKDGIPKDAFITPNKQSTLTDYEEKQWNILDII